VAPDAVAAWLAAGEPLHRRVAGLGPDLAAEIAHRAAAQGAGAALSAVLAAWGAPGPLWEYPGRLSAVELTHLGEPLGLHDRGLSAAGPWLLARLAAARAAAAAAAAAAAERRSREQAQRRAERIRADLAALPDPDELRARADALAARLAEVPARAREVRVADLRDPDRFFSIPLDPALRPGQNLDRLYDRARRTERARRALLARLAEPGPGAPPAQGPGGAGAGGAPGRPYLRYRSSDGWALWVGRNGRENDRLVREARPWDLWLHVRDAPGAHVLVRGPGREARVPDRTLAEAAGLAALHSRRSGEGAVDVMVLAAGRVRKPKGASPGRVTVAGERTLRVVPGAGNPRPEGS
ncbi:MAG: NFACT RNA binding domain-containing protein, partial [Deferrisomatales bacterium]